MTVSKTIRALLVHLRRTIERTTEGFSRLACRLEGFPLRQVGDRADEGDGFTQLGDI